MAKRKTKASPAPPPEPLPPPSPPRGTLQFLLENLPGHVRQIVAQQTGAPNSGGETPPAQALDPGASACQDFLSQLPPEVAEKMRQEEATQTKTDEQWSYEPRWCVCLAPEGEFPTVKHFRTVEGLSRFLARQEGKEIAAWVFYGVPLRFTEPDEIHQRRFLELPGGAEVLLTGAAPTEKPTRLPVTLLEEMGIAWEEDGWLGDPALAPANSEEYHLPDAPMKPAAKKPRREDDGEPSGEGVPLD